MTLLEDLAAHRDRLDRIAAALDAPARALLGLLRRQPFCNVAALADLIGVEERYFEWCRPGSTETLDDDEIGAMIAEMAAPLIEASGGWVTVTDGPGLRLRAPGEFRLATVDELQAVLDGLDCWARVNGNGKLECGPTDVIVDEGDSWNITADVRHCEITSDPGVGSAMCDTSAALLDAILLRLNLAPDLPEVQAPEQLGALRTGDQGFASGLSEQGRAFLELVAESRVARVGEVLDTLGIAKPQALRALLAEIDGLAREHRVELPYEAVSIDGERGWRWREDGPDWIVALPKAERRALLEHLTGRRLSRDRGAIDQLVEVVTSDALYRLGRARAMAAGWRPGQNAPLEARPPDDDCEEPRLGVVDLVLGELSGCRRALFESLRAGPVPIVRAAG